MRALALVLATVALVAGADFGGDENSGLFGAYVAPDDGSGSGVIAEARRDLRPTQPGRAFVREGPDQAGSVLYSGPPAYVAPPDETDGRNVCLNDQLEVIGTACAEAVEEPETEEPEEPEGPPALVTLADIASFFPTPPSVTTEPDGIGAKNMPLNSVATSSTQTLAGELFGFPVSVTFTPAGFRQDWGDGTVTDSRHGGASWAALGQAEFSPTATSHAYTAKGTYDLTVTALYTAVVDFGEWGTRAVDGLISVPGAARALRIVEVHTALVAHDCVADPAGAGCPGS